MDATVDEMMADYWAHYYADNPNAQEEVVDDDFNFEEELARIEAEAEAKGPLPKNVNDWEELP